MHIRRLLRLLSPLLLGLLALVAVTWLHGAEIRDRQMASITLAFTVATCTTPIGVLWAHCLTQWHWPGRRLAMFLLLAMAMIPLYVQAASWEAGFGKLGWYTVAQSSPDSTAVIWLTSWRAAVWVYVVALLPWVVAIASAGMMLMDGQQDDLTRLAPSASMAWWRGTLPRLAPTIALCYTYVASVVATELTVADLYMIDTVARELYLGFAIGNSLTENWLLTAPTMVAWLAWLSVTLYLVQRQMFSAQRIVFWSQARPTSARQRVYFVTTVLLPLLLLSALPLGSLLFVAGRAAENVDGVIRRSWLPTNLWDNLRVGFAEFRGEMAWTVVIGMVSASAVVVLARLQVGIARRFQSAAVAFTLGNAFLLVIPGPLLGLSLVRIFNTPSLPWLQELYDHSIAGPVAVGVLRSLPLATASLFLLVRSIPRSVTELAALDGHGAWTRWRRVEWPMTRGVLAIIWLLCVAMTMGEHSATFAVTPPGITTMAHRIFMLIHSGARQKQASLTLLALSSFALLAILTATVASLRTRRRW